MVLGMTWRYRAAIGALAVLTAVALGACGKKDNSRTPQAGATTTTAAGGESTIGGSPTPGTDGTTQPPKSTAPTYPADAKAYAQALLSAWGRKDYARIDQLAIFSAVQQIKDSVSTGGVPNTNWTYILCDGTMGSTYCTFRNANGDETIIRLNNSQLGHPTAVTEAPLERTQFATTVTGYAENFRTAWEKGNVQRMLAYGTSALVSTVKSKKPVTSYTTQECTTTEGTFVYFAGLGGDLGQSFGLKLDKSLATQGRKHAVTGYVSDNPCL